METIEISECPSCGNTHIYPFEIGRASSTIFVRRIRIRSTQKFTRFFNCPKTGNMFQALITIVEGKKPQANASPISPLNVALFESAKRELTESIDVARKFSQFMITLSAVLIPTYLALLKFVGIDEDTVPVVLKVISVVPPFLFLVSCILFIIACFPKTGEYSPEVLEEIVSVRDNIIQKRRKWIFWATTLFSLGIFVLIITIIIGLNN